LSLSR